MRESVIYQDIRAEAIAEGRAEGKAEGRAEGKQEGEVSLVLRLQKTYRKSCSRFTNADSRFINRRIRRFRRSFIRFYECRRPSKLAKLTKRDRTYSAIVRDRETR